MCHLDNRIAVGHIFQLLAHLDQLGTNLLQAIEQLHIATHRVGDTVFEILSSTCKGHTALLNEVVYQFQIFDIFGGKHTVTLLVFVWLQNIEFCLPMTQQ